MLAVFAFATTADGEPVVESHQGVLYRGSTLAGEPVGSAAPRPPGPVPAEPLREVAGFRVEPADAVVYSECSTIWNPIHTDPRAARVAGLSQPVLHGTATLARIDLRPGRLPPRRRPDPARPPELRFTAPIAAGDEAAVAATELHDGALAFRTSKDGGVAVLDHGIVETRPN